MFGFSILFTTWTLRLVEADIRTSVMDAQKALVRSTASDINDKIELRRDALKTVAELLSQADLGPGADLDAFFKPRPVLQKMFDAVLVVDASGRVLHDLPHGAAGEFTGLSASDSPFFRHVMEGDPLVIGSPQKSKLSGEPFVFFAAPLWAKDGRVKGALLCALYVTHANFLGNLAKIRIGQGGYFVVVERSETPTFLFHQRRELITTLAPGGLGNPVLAQAALGLVETVEGMNQYGVETLRSFTQLQGVPWVLVSVYPTAEAFASLRARQREVLWVGGVLFVSASALAWLISGWLLRPLAGLRELMDRHASDPGLALPPESIGSAEVAALMVAYNAQATSRREFENRLQASEKRMRDVADNLPALIGYLNQDENYVFINATFKTWLGIDPQWAVGRQMQAVIGPELYAEFRDKFRRCLEGERVTFETEADTLVGRKILQIDYIPDRGHDGAVVGAYTLGHDVTESREAQTRLGRLVRLDSLTGLYNRYQFNEELPVSLARGVRSGLMLALLFLDIDHFKLVNDTFGHAVGDMVLKEFANRLKHSVRQTDLVARLAGDEFIVVLEGLHDQSEADSLAKNILAAINQPFEVGEQILTVTSSIGIALNSASPEPNAMDLLARADTALYRAKASGRSTFHIWRSEDIKQ